MKLFNFANESIAFQPVYFASEMERLITAIMAHKLPKVAQACPERSLLVELIKKQTGFTF